MRSKARTEPGISIPRRDTQKTPAWLPVLCRKLTEDGDDLAQHGTKGTQAK